MSQTIAPSSPASAVRTTSLVSLAQVKAWLNITDVNADAVLTPLIAVASRQLIASIDRGPNLGYRMVTETRHGTGTDSMQLRYWPVLSVSFVSINNRQVLPNNDPPFGNGWTLEPWQGSDIQGRQRLFSSGQWFDRGPQQNVVVTYACGYVTVDTTTVPQGTQGADTSYIPIRPFMSNGGVYDVGTMQYMTRVQVPPTASLTYQEVNGVYTFFGGDEGRPILIRYSYLPEELAQVVTNFTSLQFKYRDHIGVNSKTLLGKETISYERGKWDSLTEALISPYRDVSPLL